MAESSKEPFLETAKPESEFGDQMTQAVNQLFFSLVDKYRDLGKNVLNNLRTAATRRSGQVGTAFTVLSLAAACGGGGEFTTPTNFSETATKSPITAPAPAYKPELVLNPTIELQTARPADEATVSAAPAPDVKAEPLVTVIPTSEAQVEKEVIPKIQITGEVSRVDEENKMVVFNMPEAVIGSENPLIPKGETGVYKFQLDDVGIKSINVSDLLNLGQHGPFKGISMSVPDKGSISSMGGEDMLASLEAAWKNQDQDFPKLDSEARETISNIRVTLVRLNDGRLQVAVFIPNQPYTYQTLSGEFLVDQRNISFRFEQDGDKPITGDGSILSEKGQIAEIKRFSIGPAEATVVTGKPIIVKSEAAGKSDVRVVVETPGQESKPVSKATPEPQVSVNKEPIPMVAPGKSVEDQVREQNELLQKTPTLSLTPANESIAYKLNEDGSITFEKTAYNNIYHLKLKKDALSQDGPNVVSLDLKSFAGMTIHVLPELKEAANFAIAVPKTPEQISQLEQTIDVAKVIADITENIPFGALNQDQARFAAAAIDLGFENAIHNYSQHLHNQYGIENPEAVEALLLRASEEALIQQATRMINEVYDNLAQGQALPDYVQRDLDSLKNSIGQTIKTQGIDAAISDLKTRVGGNFDRIKQQYGSYVTMTKQEVMGIVEQQLAKVFEELVPNLKSPDQLKLPKHLAKGKIEIRNGRLELPVSDDGVVSLAVEELAGLKEIMIKGRVNDQEEFVVKVIRIRS